MQTTNLGNPSAKVKQGMQFKRYLRTERICRLELAGYTDTQISLVQGITTVRVGQIKRTPEYLAIRASLTTGVVADAQKEMIEDVENVHELLRDMVPDALLALRDTLLDKANPTLRYKAAQDLLDREGSMAKISRSEVSLPKTFDFEQHQKVTETLLEVLQRNENSRDGAQGGAQGNKAASATGSNNAVAGTNIPETDNPALDGVAEFTTAGLTRDSQKELQKALDLISGVELLNTPVSKIVQ